MKLIKSKELSKYKNTPKNEVSSSIYGLHVTINYNVLTDKIQIFHISDQFWAIRPPEAPLFWVKRA